MRLWRAKILTRLSILSVLLSVLITTGCRTTGSIKITLPPKPEREEIEVPHTLYECATVICYYEYLLREWEAWGETVSNLVE